MYMNKTYNMKKMILVLLMFIGTISSAQLCLSNFTNVSSTQPNGVISGDFNNDGKSDVVTSNWGGNSVHIYFGNGLGALSAPSSFPTNGLNPNKMAVGLINSDANLDLVVVNGGSGQVSLLLGNGVGSFATAVTFTTNGSSPSDVCIADFNNDAKLDVVVTNATGNTFDVLLGNGAGTFTSNLNYATGGSMPVSVVAALLNSDSNYDLVISNRNSNNITVLLGTGFGTFGAATMFSTTSNTSDSFVAFFNSDNILDIVSASSTNTFVQVLLGTGTGSFLAATNYSSQPFQSISGADFNLDGKTDVAGVLGGTLSVLLGTGTGSFSTAINYPIGLNSTELTITDFNSNGNTDIALTSYNSSTLSVFLNGAVSFTANTPWTICSGVSTTLTAFGASTYTWSNNSTGSVIVVNPTANTTFTLTGTAASCTNTTTRTFTVNALPNLTITGVNPICVGSTASLSVSGASTYVWNNTSTLSSVNFTPSSNTTYSVVGTNTNGCVNFAAVNVTVNPLPTLTITGANSLCYGNNITLTVSGASSYSWSTGSSSTTVVVNPTVNVGYSVVGTNTNGCVNFASKNIVVNPLPSVTISGNTVICIGNTTTLTASGASTYTWSTGSTVTAISVNPTVNVNYSVIGVDANGCTNFAPQSIVVNLLPNVSIIGTSVICSGNTATLSASGAVTYVWSNTSTLSSIAVIPTSNTTYSVVGVDGNGCINSALKTVTVNASPTVTIAGSNVVCTGETSSLIASGASSYTWNNGSNSVNIAVAPTANTIYSVVGLNSNGCESSAAITVSVSECTGIKSNAETLEALVQVFPNPNNGNFSIKSDVDLNVMVINEMGQVVKTVVLNYENNNQLNMSELSYGFYSVIFEKDGHKIAKKVIVTK